MAKYRFPLESVVVVSKTACTCVATCRVRLIGYHETRICNQCNTVYCYKSLSKADYIKAQSDIFL